MLRYRTGAASTPAAGQAMARYLASETLKPENPERAQYYAVLHGRARAGTGQ